MGIKRAHRAASTKATTPKSPERPAACKSNAELGEDVVAGGLVVDDGLVLLVEEDELVLVGIALEGGSVWTVSPVALTQDTELGTVAVLLSVRSAHLGRSCQWGFRGTNL